MKRVPTPKVHKHKAILEGEYTEFPLPHYSYSAMAKFSEDPFLFKVNYINGDTIDTATNVSTVLGIAVHKAMQTFLGGDEDRPVSPQNALQEGYEAGRAYLESYSDGLIKYSTTTATREKLNERYSFAYFGYVKEYAYEKRVKETVLVEKKLKHKVEVDGKVLPIPLVAKLDHAFHDHSDRLILEDHKFVSSYSNPDEIDGAKLLQATIAYFVAYAETGEEPYSMLFREFKTSENKDKSPQTREYEIVYSEHRITFEFFFRFYGDITRALLGHQVYVPNIRAIFDREVSLLGYIHRLDVSEERAKLLAKEKVDNITDFLKKRIEKDGAMKRYLDTVSKAFVSSKSLNYKAMTPEEKIRMKMAEHGKALNIHSKVVGGAVTLYRYEPSVGLKMKDIENYTKDVEQVLATSGVRVLAPIPDSDLVGFEVPNKTRSFPGKAPGIDGFRVAIGQTIQGETRYLDIREAPHVLVAGTTGSGKSVFLEQVIEQLGAIGPNTAQIALFDPKLVELGKFQNGVNVRVYADDAEIIGVELKKLTIEMNRRYAMMKERNARNMEEYRANGGRLPYIFVVIDEFGDLILQRGDLAKQIRNDIIKLGQKARASGIHIILTTQRPSVKVVDGLIKANFPTRIAFRTASEIDSRVILDAPGAEKLLGKGDMLLLDPTRSGLERLQGYK